MITPIAVKIGNFIVIRECVVVTKLQIRHIIIKYGELDFMT